MTETHVTGAAMRVLVEIDGVPYALRPITFGEAAQVSEAEAAVFLGGPAMVAEAIREALRAKGGPDATRHIEAVDAHEEADAAFTAIALTKPHAQEPLEAWETYRREMRAAQQALMLADNRRKVAEAQVADAAPVVAAKVALIQAQAARAVAMLKVALVDCPADPRELPSAHALRLYAQAQKMANPGRDEGKA